MEGMDSQNNLISISRALEGIINTCARYCPDISDGGDDDGEEMQAQSKMLAMAPGAALAVGAAIYALSILSHHVQVEVFVI